MGKQAKETEGKIFNYIVCDDVDTEELMRYIAIAQHTNWDKFVDEMKGRGLTEREAIFYVQGILATLDRIIEKLIEWGTIVEEPTNEA